MKGNVTEKTVLDFGQLKSRDGEWGDCRHGNPHEQTCWEWRAMLGDQLRFISRNSENEYTQGCDLLILFLAKES